jgi:hypothetical protein
MFYWDSLPITRNCLQESTMNTNFDHVIAELRGYAVDNDLGDLAVSILWIEGIIQDPTSYTAEEIGHAFAKAVQVVSGQLQEATQDCIDSPKCAYGNLALDYIELMAGLAMECDRLQEAALLAREATGTATAEESPAHH